MTRAHDSHDERAHGRRSDLSNLHAVVLGRVGASPLLQYIMMTALIFSWIRADR